MKDKQSIDELSYVNSKQKIGELKCYRDDKNKYRVSFEWTWTYQPDVFYFIDVGHGKTEKEAYMNAGLKLALMASKAFKKVEGFEK